MDANTEDQANSPLQNSSASQKHGKEEKRKRPLKKPKGLNPLQRGIHKFLTNELAALAPQSLDSNNTPPASTGRTAEPRPEAETLVSSLPKRFTVYQPLLLLPANAFSVPQAWGTIYASLNDQQKDVLYASIVEAFKDQDVTHLAMNAPIVMTDLQGQENIMRSPVGLTPLYGDFGDVSFTNSTLAGSQPSQSDLETAFWVRAVQNHGIVQIWAPLYTMFSRGNITEKARILGQREDSGASSFEGLDEPSLHDQAVHDTSVVDMYAGIGYFVFSYLKRGVKRVWGWEINGWSVEGLRRGCVANGWGCRVVRVHENGTLEPSVSDLVHTLQDTDRVVIFHGDNSSAAEILEKVKQVMEQDGEASWSSVRHVNLGLLPSSRDSWANACRMIDDRRGGWLHVHENVAIHEIQQKSEEIRTALTESWEQSTRDTASTVECRHTERVKTYAPGVMHCVFDMALSRCMK
ncbi:hypothetical protein ASPZODRAFT_56649 [Penicilliopsis zonata CBS 506.65]|uniref:tRNA wybutosine-synthesizing protein 2 n=1 Tax=Penicilliopsis zonata CBS 506.65 TaxID=1073090 RepID=A0A1L9SUL8_9EURO|nr:hypothetical protein ASPZODRAFT_56649 [Penicilliopsis zonata CBS 506.65]OJJ50912.1 hypothetical protein ASPZODRAFT_56649 [Penicilliopsis zonata CBS 506.65]